MDKMKVVLIVIIIALCVLLAIVLVNHFVHNETTLPQMKEINITAATMTTGIDADGAPTDSVTQYGTGDEFIASCTLDTDESVLVMFDWKREGKEFHHDSVYSKDGYAHDIAQSGGAWEPGDYSVDIDLVDGGSPGVTLEFTVE